MSLKNLSQRYEEKVNQLYAGATLKFENGKPSREFNDDPLNVRLVGDESFGRVSRALGRFLPVVRVGQDVVRLTKFLASTRGITFLAKQYLLQTGNTFEQTRLLNPFFVLGAAATPAAGNIVRMRRHLNSSNNLFEKTDTTYRPRYNSAGNSNSGLTSGQLQETTYNQDFFPASSVKKFTFSSLKPASPLNAVKDIGAKEGWEKSRPELKDYIKTLHNSSVNVDFKYGGAVKNYSLDIFAGNKYGTVSTTNSETTLVKYSSKDWVTTVTTDYRRESPTRLLINTTADASTTRTTDASTTRTTELGNTANATALRTRTPFISELLSTQTSSFGETNKIDELYAEFSQSLRVDPQQSSYQEKYKKVNPVGYIAYFSGSGTNSIRGQLRLDGTNARDIADVSGNTSYVRDPSNNNLTSGLSPQVMELSRYRNIPTETDFDDPIVVSFAMGNNKSIPFRAFIKDLNHNINPEYKTNQYIGRIDKFISYVSVQRELSFKLGVIAFSKDELTMVWKRINYLTGMAFPYGISRGILQPNIIKLTIGKLFIDQPGYVTSINTNFNDISESWDIDAKVPIGATVDIKFSIIEKTTSVADSSFYGING